MGDPMEKSFFQDDFDLSSVKDFLGMRIEPSHQRLLCWIKLWVSGPMDELFFPRLVVALILVSLRQVFIDKGWEVFEDIRRYGFVGSVPLHGPRRTG